MGRSKFIEAHLPSGVEGLMHLLDEGAVDMGVDLCGDDGAVAENFLYCPEVCSSLVQVGGEGVSQGVRAYFFCDPRCRAATANNRIS